MDRSLFHPEFKARPYWWEDIPIGENPEAELPAKADVVIVGGGLTGLNCAIELGRGGASAVVLEAEDFGFGASTRNGGGVSGGINLGKGMSGAKGRDGQIDSVVREMIGDAAESFAHIEAVIAWCAPLQPEDQTLRALRTAVTSIGQRDAVKGRLERRDGSVVDLATLPLPDGATLVTFQDVTDTVNVERALRERNEALETADQVKIDFLHHVSYELRSPLTNIIGFAHFLGDRATGPLTRGSCGAPR